MKKLLIIATVILSSTVFAAESGTMMQDGKCNCPMMSEMKMEEMGKMKDSMMANMTPENKKLMQEHIDAIKENRTELKKAMLDEKVDWDKVKKINESTADHRTEMMKLMHDVEKTPVKAAK
ncbi:MAG: hypothetical protein RR476_08845 [Cetobacterium sp.]|uniref:hypothetical protein n=1 Tax=Cetobacterium sp. TaxID=2071632 RepID=UPI002FCA4B63